MAVGVDEVPVAPKNGVNLIPLSARHCGLLVLKQNEGVVGQGAKRIGVGTVESLEKISFLRKMKTQTVMDERID